MNHSGERLDRLNYFNGQRLEAADFRQEQRYHIFVRRALNRSLYSDGIAAGLEVTPKPGDLHKVIVSSGLALDQDGREIILLEPAEVQVVGAPSVVEGVVFGNYLCIHYHEVTTALVEDGCAPVGGTVERKWGGPSRIRADARLFFRPTWPKPLERQIVLAQVELDKSCAVRQIHTAVRKYAGIAPKAKVRSFALEGEADIDMENSKKIYFHIRGGRPDTMTLYLKGERFSTLFYTELGRHTHDINITTKPDGSHKHDVGLGDLSMNQSGKHDHVVMANVQGAKSLETDEGGGTYADLVQVNMHVSEGAHSHDIAGLSVEVLTKLSDHAHQIDEVTEPTGVSLDARALGNPLTYVNNLHILLDGVDCTAKICSSLSWTQIGNGSDSHDFVTKGTGAIELELLGADVNEGQHILELKVTDGGGRVRYNLYVE